jgi:hypothetical protein
MLVLGGAAGGVGLAGVQRSPLQKRGHGILFAVAFTALLIALAVLSARFRLMYDIRNNPDKMVIEQLSVVPEECGK